MQFSTMLHFSKVLETSVFLFVFFLAATASARDLSFEGTQDFTEFFDRFAQAKVRETQEGLVSEVDVFINDVGLVSVPITYCKQEKNGVLNCEWSDAEGSGKLFIDREYAVGEQRSYSLLVSSKATQKFIAKGEQVDVSFNVIASAD